MFFKLNNFIGIYPEILLILSVLFLIGYLVIYEFFFHYKIIFINLGGFLAMLSLFLILILVKNNLNLDFQLFQSLVVSDFLSMNAKFILCLFCILLFSVSFSYLKRDLINNYEYFLVSLLAVLGILIITSAYDLMTVYLAVELQSLCFYVLATFKPHNNFSTEAGIKYFILGAFSSGLLLLGMSLLYGYTGLTDFYSFSLFFQQNNEWNAIIWVGLLLFLCGLLFKLAVAPFHMWVPDIYEGSPTSVTAFFAIIPKLSILVLLSRSLLIAFNSHLYYNVDKLFLICALLSLVLGSLGALYQTKIKRLLAYSAVSHAGFLLLGLSTLSIEGLYSVVFYIFVYMLLSLGLFTILLNLRHSTHNLKIKKINEIITLLSGNFSLSIMLTIMLFSLAGIPPLLGFYMKFYVFMSSIQSSYYIITILAAVISVVSALYYVRLIKLIFFKKFTIFSLYRQLSWVSSYVISFVITMNFFFLLLPDLIVAAFHNIVLTLII